MALVKVKPTSPGRRGLVKVVNANLYKGRPIDALTESKKRGSGRNNNGHITMRHKGGGHKRTWHFCSTPTASVATSWRREASSPARS